MNAENLKLKIGTVVLVVIFVVGLAVRFEIVAAGLRSDWKATREMMWTAGDMHLWEHRLRESNAGKVSVPSTEEIIRSRPQALIPRTNGNHYFHASLLP